MTEAAGEGPAVVLLHGAFFGSAVWAAQAQAPAQAPAPVLVRAGRVTGPR